VTYFQISETKTIGKKTQQNFYFSGTIFEAELTRMQFCFKAANGS